MKLKILLLFCAIFGLNVDAAVLIKLINCSESQAEYQIYENKVQLQSKMLAIGESKEISLQVDLSQLNAKTNQELAVSYLINKQSVTSMMIPAHHKMCSHIRGVTKKCYDFDYSGYINEPLPLFLCTMKAGNGTTMSTVSQGK